MSEKAKRWQRYSYLGRLKQARNTLQSLSKESFLDSDTTAHVAYIDQQIKTLYANLISLIEDKK